jgi:beta-phosphoglucomutase
MGQISQIRAPEAILFDNDGVLLASEALHWVAWEKLLADLDIPYNNAEMREYVGKTAPEVLMATLNRHRPGWDPAVYDLVTLAQKKNEIYLSLARTSLVPYLGVVDGLRWLRSQAIKTAVVTNARRSDVLATITITGLKPLLDLVVSRDDVSAPKPDPSSYLFAAASLRIPPARCLAVEDSPTGLLASLQAGIPSVAVATNFGIQSLQNPVPDRPSLRPLWVGQNMGEFFDWLKSLRR